MRVKTYLNINAKEVPVIGTVEKTIENPSDLLAQFNSLDDISEPVYLVRFTVGNVEMRGYWKVRHCETLDNVPQ